ncbi:MAG: HAD-IA family hydrolase [Actinobacteria bacterium]|uniref:Unannotated protein n=1 Tax=freshwater metagenome TaxID=449393 RepID=A0A6J5ZRU0_9ZZZZ|nr:HAD-IA family hydrolase [Actinomycetota bacterium]
MTLSGAPAAVIFDNDGLTLDTEDLWTEAEKALFANYSADFGPAQKLALLGNSGADAAVILARELGQPDGDGPALVAEMNRLVYLALEEGCEPTKGAVELLTALRDAGIPRALCSNSPLEFVGRAVDAAGVRNYFDVIVSADEVAHGKPAPDPYLEAARRLGVDPQLCVALEDSVPGATSASAAGMTVFVVPSFEETDFGDVADRSFASLAEPELWAALGVRGSA